MGFDFPALYSGWGNGLDSVITRCSLASQWKLWARPQAGAPPAAVRAAVAGELRGNAGRASSSRRCSAAACLGCHGGVWPPQAWGWGTRVEAEESSPKSQFSGVQLAAWQILFLLQHANSSLEKETATHSSILAWRIPWTEEPGRL